MGMNITAQVSVFVSLPPATTLTSYWLHCRWKCSLAWLMFRPKGPRYCSSRWRSCRWSRNIIFKSSLSSALWAFSFHQCLLSFSVGGNSKSGMYELSIGDCSIVTAVSHRNNAHSKNPRVDKVEGSLCPGEFHTSEVRVGLGWTLELPDYYLVDRANDAVLVCHVLLIINDNIYFLWVIVVVVVVTLWLLLSLLLLLLREALNNALCEGIATPAANASAQRGNKCVVDDTHLPSLAEDRDVHPPSSWKHQVPMEVGSPKVIIRLKVCLLLEGPVGTSYDFLESSLMQRWNGTAFSITRVVLSVVNMCTQHFMCVVIIWCVMLVGTSSCSDQHCCVYSETSWLTLQHWIAWKGHTQRIRQSFGQ